ncbi:hypothetical protein F4801DRAFT_561834 [Xylaria longipes]|nr:hypothetical protein F4801DRAFT_561834 [Xylaria longipes]RYC63377.1 hypothetical protein CHU98_g2803 [Xylaria longipes]
MSGIVHHKALLIGFVSNVSLPQYFRDLFGTAEEIRGKLDADHARIQRAGITPVSFELNPQEKEKGLAELEALLREEKYDAIGIGAGVRLHPDHTALFETIVNLCRRTAPSVPLMFNDGPDGSTKTLERVLGLRIP